MKKFKLNNGIEIPALGLGVYRLKDNKLAQETVETALSVGYRHIDTATVYENEEAVGRAIKNSGIPRDELFVTTKLWNEDQKSGKADQAIDLSLKKLGLDYVDLYLVHWPLKDTYVNVWAKMEKIQKDGKTKSIGVSNYHAQHLDALLEKAEIIPVINQIESYPYLAQEALIKYCLDKNIYPEAWGPLGAGQTDLLDNTVVNAIAQKYNKTAAQVVLRWHLERNTVVIPKSINKERQAENLNVFDFELTTDEVKQITALNSNKRLGSDPDVLGFQ